MEGNGVPCLGREREGGGCCPLDPRTVAHNVSQFLCGTPTARRLHARVWQRDGRDNRRPSRRGECRRPRCRSNTGLLGDARDAGQGVAAIWSALMVQRSLRVRHGSAVPPLFLLLSFPTPATLRPIRCLGVEVSFAESMSVDGMAAAVRPNTKLLYGGNNPGFCQLSSGVLRSLITYLILCFRNACQSHTWNFGPGGVFQPWCRRGSLDHGRLSLIFTLPSQENPTPLSPSPLLPLCSNSSPPLFLLQQRNSG